MFGEVYVMLGGLHIELAVFRGVNNLLQGSGWIIALVDASITTQGKAESFLQCSHVTQTRHGSPDDSSRIVHTAEEYI